MGNGGDGGHLCTVVTEKAIKKLSVLSVVTGGNP